MMNGALWANLRSLSAGAAGQGELTHLRAPLIDFVLEKFHLERGGELVAGAVHRGGGGKLA